MTSRKYLSGRHWYYFQAYVYILVDPFPTSVLNLPFQHKLQVLQFHKPNAQTK